MCIFPSILFSILCSLFRALLGLPYSYLFSFHFSLVRISSVFITYSCISWNKNCDMRFVLVVSSFLPWLTSLLLNYVFFIDYSIVLIFVFLTFMSISYLLFPFFYSLFMNYAGYLSLNLFNFIPSPSHFGFYFLDFNRSLNFLTLSIYFSIFMLCVLYLLSFQIRNRLRHLSVWICLNR
jgi:hypothetical protein